MMITFLVGFWLQDRRQAKYLAERLKHFEDEMRRMQRQLHGATPEVAKKIEGAMLKTFVDEVVDVSPRPAARLLRGHGPTTPTGAP